MRTPSERQLLAALRELTSRDPQARALFREVMAQVEAVRHVQRLRRIE